MPRSTADNVKVSLMKGEVKSLVLSNDDKVVYLRALKALKSTGTALDLTAHQFAESVKVVGRASLIEAARYDRDDLSAPGWRNLTTLIASVLRLQTEAKRCARK